MRITYITAGAGGMYCGSCIRDNALAKALTAAGHDVLLLPLYTPLLTDDENISADRVFYGGISVYLEQHLSLFRHTPWLVDRLWEAPWLIRALADRAVQTSPERLGDLTVSVLEGRDGRQAKEIAKLLHWLAEQPRPDVIDISNSMLIALARPLKEALRAPVCCTLQGEDIFLGHLPEPHHSRALALIAKHSQYVDRFIAVSDYCAERMSRLAGIPGAKIDVVPLGINLDGYERRTPPRNNGLTIGHFGRVAPEKGLHVLWRGVSPAAGGGQARARFHRDRRLPVAGASDVPRLHPGPGARVGAGGRDHVPRQAGPGREARVPRPARHARRAGRL